jgi:hypothetical protein
MAGDQSSRILAFKRFIACEADHAKNQGTGTN